MVSNIEKPLKVNSTLATLLSELGEECETVLFLLSQLRLFKLNILLETEKTGFLKKPVFWTSGDFTRWEAILRAC